MGRHSEQATPKYTTLANWSFSAEGTRKIADAER